MPENDQIHYRKVTEAARQAWWKYRLQLPANADKPDLMSFLAGFNAALNTPMPIKEPSKADLPLRVWEKMELDLRKPPTIEQQMDLNFRLD